jgi:hypothetical protein
MIEGELLLRCMSPELCRFSDAGVTKLSPRSDSRRPKSAKARNRDVLGTGWQRALWRFQISIGVDWGLDASTTRPACPHVVEVGSVAWRVRMPWERIIGRTGE